MILKMNSSMVKFKLSANILTITNENTLFKLTSELYILLKKKIKKLSINYFIIEYITF